MTRNPYSLNSATNATTIRPGTGNYGMDFKTWLILESGRFDREAFNSLFRRQLEELLPRVNDQRRRASLERVRGTDWTGYILTALRNAGLGDDRDREEATHDVVVQLLV